MPEYTIYIEALTFDAIIGILDKERKEAQKVVVDIELCYVKKDETFINYAEIAALVKKEIVDGKYLLLEEALEAVIEKIQAYSTSIKSIKVKITKPDILDNCHVAVESLRNF